MTGTPATADLLKKLHKRAANPEGRPRSHLAISSQRDAEFVGITQRIEISIDCCSTFDKSVLAPNSAPRHMVPQGNYLLINLQM